MMTVREAERKACINVTRSIGDPDEFEYQVVASRRTDRASGIVSSAISARAQIWYKFTLTNECPPIYVQYNIMPHTTYLLLITFILVLMSSSPPCVFYAEGPDFTTVPAGATANARFPRYESVSFQNSSLTAEICATIILDDIACETQESFAFNLNNNDPSVCTDMGFPPQYIVLIEDATRECDTCACSSMKWPGSSCSTTLDWVLYRLSALTVDHHRELVVSLSN